MSDAEPAPPDLGPLFETYQSIGRAIADEIPNLIEVQSVIVDGLRPLTLVVHEQMDASDPIQAARSKIVHQALNDYLDLLFEASTGRGRPAVRSARSIFEHLVNQRWISSSVAEAQRYLDHAAIDRELELQLDTPAEETFVGSERKAYRHWRRKAERQIIPAAKAVLAKYKPSFRRAWSETNLHGRASAHALGGEYDTYRLLSAAIHGSAGGDMGHRIELDGVPILRTGAAVSVCPLAFRSGTRYLDLLLSDLAQALGVEATDRLQQAVATVGSMLDQHRRVCLGIDQSMWPSEVPHTVLFLSVPPVGKWRWFLLDPEEAKTIWADPIGVDATMLLRLEQMVSATEAANPGRDRPIVIAVEAEGRPRLGAGWQPARQHLRRQDLVFGPKPTYTTLTDEPAQYDPSLYDKPPF